MNAENIGESKILESNSLYNKLVHGTDVEPTKKVVKGLERKNPILRPDNIRMIEGLEGFSDFKPINLYGDEDNIIWIRESARTKLINIINNGKIPLTVLFSGLGTSGKNTILDRIIEDEYLGPHIAKPLTTTTREKRDTEINGKDYEFVNKREFLFEVNDDEFVEAVDQYGNYYGTKVKSLDEAINQNRCFIVSQVEVGGWSDVSDYILLKSRMPIFSIFVLPERKYKEYLKFLRDTRGDEQYDKRSKRAVWELEQASNIADLVLINRTNEDFPGIGASDYLTILLSEILSNQS